MNKAEIIVMQREPLMWIDQVPEGQQYIVPVKKEVILRGNEHSLIYSVSGWRLHFSFSYNSVGDSFTVSVRDLDADEDLLQGQKLMPYQNALQHLHSRGYQGIYLIPRPKSAEKIDSLDSHTLNESAELVLYAPEAELEKDGSEHLPIRLERIWAVHDDVKGLVRDYLRSQSISDATIEQTLGEHGKCQVLIERAHDPVPDNIHAAIGGSGTRKSFHIQYFCFSRGTLTDTVRIMGIKREAAEMPVQLIQSFIQGAINDNHQWHHIVDNALEQKSYREVLRKLGFRRQLISRPLRMETVWKPVPFFKYGVLTGAVILGYVALASMSWSSKISTIVSSVGLLLNTAGAIWLARPLLKKDTTIEQLVDTGEAWHSRVNRRQRKSMQQDRRMGLVGIGLLIIGIVLQLGTTIIAQTAIDILGLMKNVF